MDVGKQVRWEVAMVLDIDGLRDVTELYVADEAFLCGTGAELQIIGMVDRYKVGDGNAGPVATELGAAVSRYRAGHRPSLRRVANDGPLTASD